MRRLALLPAVAWAAASAQTVLPAERGAELFARPIEAPLKCEVRPLRPVLDFSFRFRAGYVAAAPLSQYRGPGHRWTMLVRLQSTAAASPVYFLDHVRLPDVPITRMSGEVGGGFMLGEGSYRASFLLRDEQGRACRAEWNIEARLRPSDRHVTLAIEPGKAEAVSLRGRSPAPSPGGAPLARLTVLLNAAPTSPRRETIQASDAVTLLGALSSLLDLAPADSVRLVVFNLDQQREVYRREHFTPDQLPAVRQAMFELQLGIVDYQTLQHPEGRTGLLAGLVRQELEAENRSDAVVFLGPNGRAAERVDLSTGNQAADPPKFFYVEYQQPLALALALGRDAGRPDPYSAATERWARRSDADIIRPDVLGTDFDPPNFLESPHDTIAGLVAALKGKTMVIHTPYEFAKAVERIARRR